MCVFVSASGAHTQNTHPVPIGFGPVRPIGVFFPLFPPSLQQLSMYFGPALLIITIISNYLYDGWIDVHSNRQRELRLLVSHCYSWLGPMTAIKTTITRRMAVDTSGQVVVCCYLRLSLFRRVESSWVVFTTHLTLLPKRGLDWDNRWNTWIEFNSSICLVVRLMQSKRRLVVHSNTRERLPLYSRAANE